MNILDFTVEEASLIGIYVAESRAATIEQIINAQPHMDEQMRAIAARSAAKLATMSDSEFEEAIFEIDEDAEDNVA